MPDRRIQAEYRPLSADPATANFGRQDRPILVKIGLSPPFRLTPGEAATLGRMLTAAVEVPAPPHGQPLELAVESDE